MVDSESDLEKLRNAVEDGDVNRSLALAKLLRSNVSRMDETILVATGFLAGGSPFDALKLLESLAGTPVASDLPQNRAQELEQLLKVRLAEALYSTGDPRGALESLQSVTPSGVQETSDREYFIGLCQDHLGELALAEAHFERAARLDPLRNPPIPSISEREAHLLVSGVIEELPEPLRKSLAEVPVMIEDLPDRKQIVETRGEVHPDTLGLYSGINLVDRSHLEVGDIGEIPTGASIRIYRRNLERISQDREELRSEIRITLLHEFGHHLGLDEDDVDRLGLS